MYAEEHTQVAHLLSLPVHMTKNRGSKPALISSYKSAILRFTGAGTERRLRFLKVSMSPVIVHIQSCGFKREVGLNMSGRRRRIENKEIK